MSTTLSTAFETIKQLVNVIDTASTLSADLGTTAPDAPAQ
ncbi:hypothetical protein GCM10023353_30260 [Tomitella cavernea]|uniref:Uncharacterized protein n=1 Tax=Tomitella cavernea TaxID=1387982 RepID=A0ABP9D2G0_9ACTN